MEEDRRGTTSRSGGKGQRRGTPQGGVLSPLLANLYLHVLDRTWARPEVGRGLRAKLVRYADDLVVLCARDMEPSMPRLRDGLRTLGLSLNEEKTKCVNAWEESFVFLGFAFGMKQARTGGKWYPHVEPSPKSIQRFKARVT